MKHKYNLHIVHLVHSTIHIGNDLQFDDLYAAFLYYAYQSKTYI